MMAMDLLMADTVAKGRELPAEARRSSESAIAVEALMDNSG